MAKAKETVQLATIGQKKEIAAMAAGAVTEALEELTHSQAAYWVGHKTFLAHSIKYLLCGREYEMNQESLTRWARFYEMCFALRKDFTEIRVPDYRDGFECLIVVPEGMTLERILKGFCRRGCENKVGRYFQNPSEIVSARKATRDYVVRIQGCGEAKDEAKRDDLPAITLEERLLFQLKSFFEMPGTVADMDTWELPDCWSLTSCSGSTDARGAHPLVYSTRSLETHIVSAEPADRPACVRRVVV